MNDGLRATQYRHQPDPGDDSRLVRRPLTVEDPTAQNLGIQVFNRGAEKKITAPRPPWTAAEFKREPLMTTLHAIVHSLNDMTVQDLRSPPKYNTNAQGRCAACVMERLALGRKYHLRQRDGDID